MDELHPHPPHIEDGNLDAKENPAGYQHELGQEEDDDGSDDWLRLAQQAYRFSTSWVDSNYRKRWEDGLRAFNNQHSLDSKYNSPNYDKRSKVYRPKMRSIIRKNEAAAAAAFFSNLDVVDVNPQNQSDPKQVVSAEINKLLLQYRLTNSEKGIPWFQLVLGGLQDAQKTGAVAARYEWDYESRDSMAGKKVLSDKPKVTLIPIENLRVDPAASWVDPIGTSPYIIELMPMYVGDVIERSQMVDDKTGRTKWKPVSKGQIRQAISMNPSSTQIVRERGGQDPRQPDGRPLSDYEIVWVQRHIHRKEGMDWEFYTLSDVAMLSSPRPLSEAIFTGKRNYVLGCCILETHTVLASSVPELGRGLQDEANEIANQRLDNVKFVLNKRWLVARNKNVDIGSLVRNVPGGITMMDDPQKDIVESNWPDVTSSAYQEQDRINADLDELLGNFSSSSVLQNRQAMETPMRTLGMLNSGASMLTEYLLRTYVETFVEPLLRGVVLLEQKYETDVTVMAMVQGKIVNGQTPAAQLLQRFGMDQFTDEILNQELTIKVNVGMGATDPNAKLQKFMLGIGGYVNMAKQPIPGMNLNEIGREIFGLLGYQDGRRFMTTDDPQKQQMFQMLQVAHQQVQQLAKKVDDKHEANTVKLITELEKVKKDKQIAVVDANNKQQIEILKGQIKRDELNLDAAKAALEMEKQRLSGMQQQGLQDRKMFADQMAQKDQMSAKKEDGAKQEINQIAKGLEAALKRIEELSSQVAKPRKIKIHRGKDGRADVLETLQ